MKNCEIKKLSVTKPFVRHRYVLIVLLRRCQMCCCLDKSDRNGIKTNFDFHCTYVVPSDIFKTSYRNELSR